MEPISSKSTENFTSNPNKDKNMRERKSHISPDLAFPKVKIYNELKNYSKSFEDFITKKNKITVISIFDHKGAKKFLAEKEKALEKLFLEDEIEEEKKLNKAVSKNYNKTKKTKSKNNINKIIKKYPSQNALISLKLKNNSRKSHEKIKKKVSSSKSIKIKFGKKLKKNGKTDLEKKKKKMPIEGMISKISNFKANEASYLISEENDSFIVSILNQMSTIKN